MAFFEMENEQIKKAVLKRSWYLNPPQSEDQNQIKYIPPTRNILHMIKVSP